MSYRMTIRAKGHEIRSRINDVPGTDLRYRNDMVNLDQALGHWPVPFGHIGTAGHTPVAVDSQGRRTVAPVTLIAVHFNSHPGPFWQATRIKAFLNIFFDR